MPKLSSPHDRFFRDSFSQRELAIDFCRNYLPEAIAASLDPDPQAWELRAESYVDQELGGHVADILYSTRLLELHLILLYLSASPAGSSVPDVSTIVAELAQSRGEPMVNDWQQFTDRLRAEGLE